MISWESVVSCRSTKEEIDEKNGFVVPDFVHDVRDCPCFQPAELILDALGRQ